MSTITIVYSIAPATPARLIEYVYGGDEAAIKLMGDLPTILAHYPVLLALIALSVFFAGVTSLLPTSEVGLQIIESLTGVGRVKAATYLLGSAFLIGIFDSPPSIAEATLKAVVVATFFTAIFELYPVIASKEKPSPLVLTVAGIAIAVFLIGGLYAFYNVFRAGGVYIASGLLAAIIILFGLFGDRFVSREAT